MGAVFDPAFGDGQNVFSDLSVLDSLSSAIAVVDRSGNVIWVNAVWNNLALAYSADPERFGIGSNYLTVCRNAVDDPFAADAFDGVSAVLDGSMSQFELDYPCDTPLQEQWFRLTATPLAGRRQGALISHLDVTQQYQAEESVGKQRRRFQSLVQHSGDLITVIGPDQSVSYQSPALESILGYTEQAFVGTDGFDPVHPDDRDHTRDVIRDLSARVGSTARMEMRARHRDGSWRLLDVIATNLLEDPDVRGIVFNARDATESSELRASLQETERTLLFAIEAAKMGVWDWNSTSELVKWIGANNLSPDQLAPGAFTASWKDSLDHVHPDDIALLLSDEADVRTRSTGKFETEHRVRTIDGGMRTFYNRGLAVEHDADGQVERMIGITMDISDLKTAEARYRALFDGAADPILLSDHTGRYIDVNQSAVDLLGFDRTQLLGLTVEDLAMRALNTTIDSPFERANQTRVVTDFVRQDGRRISIEGKVATVELPDGVMRVDILHDRTDQREAEAAIQASEARFRTLVEDAEEIIAVVTENGSIQYASPAFARILGYQNDLKGELLTDDLIHPDDRDPLFATWSALVASHLGARIRVEFRALTADGDWVWLSGNLKNQLSNPHIGGLVLNVRDVTHTRLRDEDLRRMALHDPLTGLANRTLMMDRLEQAITRNASRSEQTAVLFLDVDHFKTFNDGFGHAFGDALLIAITERLAPMMRSGDTFARFGGDEFVILRDQVKNQAEIEAYAAECLAELESPIHALDREVSVQVSIGIAIDDHSGELADASSYLRAADAALYTAKAEGRGRAVVYAPDLVQHRRRLLGLQRDVRGAEVRGEFELHVQPIIDLQNVTIVAAEALLRWHHPENGFIAPAEFIPLAEESGQIIRIGAWVLREACHQAVTWGEHGPFVSVNLSARQFRDPELVQRIRDILHDEHLPAERLCLEITEHTLISDMSDTISKLASLREQGVLIAIDDFGVGYSSLGYLRNLPVDILKLDRSFVSNIDGDPGALSFVDGLIKLAHSIDVAVTAEGIETQAQLQLLKTIGCDYGQGYYLGYPARILPDIQPMRGHPRATAWPDLPLE